MLGKYKATVLKFEVVITLTGEIVSFTFPHLGVRGDARVRQTEFHCTLPSPLTFCDADLERTDHSAPPVPPGRDLHWRWSIHLVLELPDKVYGELHGPF